jgi:nascent polypeptide-associated complex subunit alpha
MYSRYQACKNTCSNSQTYSEYRFNHCRNIFNTDKKLLAETSVMFGGNMDQMMKQMGMDMEEINAEKVEVHLSNGKKLVFKDPGLSKIEAQGKEIFQLQGNYSEEASIPEQDIELVMEKTEASREEAEKALENEGDVAAAVMSLQ